MTVINPGEKKKLKRTDGDVGQCRILGQGGWTIRVLGELRAASRHRNLGSRMEKVKLNQPTVGEGNDKIRETCIEMAQVNKVRDSAGPVDHV